MGTVTETIPGKDGLVRGAIVRVCSGGKRKTHLRRSIRHLYSLEINCNDLKSPTSTAEQTSTNENHNSTLSSGPIDNAIKRRPRRAAATIARDRIVAQTLSDQWYVCVL